MVVNRSPPPTESNCQRCDAPDDEEMATCEVCHRWFHLQCVLESEGEDLRNFACEECLEASQANRENLVDLSNDLLTNAGSDGHQNNSESHHQNDLILVSSNVAANGTATSPRPSGPPIEVPAPDLTRELLEEIDTMRRSHREELQSLQARMAENEKRAAEQSQRLLRRLQVHIDSSAFQGESSHGPAVQHQSSFGPVTHQPFRGPNRPPLAPLQPTPSGTFDVAGFKEKAMSAVSDTLDRFISNIPAVSGNHSAPVNVNAAQAPSTLHPRAENINSFDASFRQATESNTWDQVAVQMSRKYLQKLPEFRGEVRKWGYFEAVYNSTTESGRYSETDNVCRLREALKPPASDLVESLLNFTSNATSIMNELRESYGRPTQLMLALVDDLFKIPGMQSLTDPKLREFAIKVNNFVANVKAIGKHEELSSGITLEKLTQKLYVLHHLEWKRSKAANESLNVEDFALFINNKVKEIPDRYLVGSTSPVNKRAKVENRYRRVNAHQETSSSSSVPIACENGCFKCGSNHLLPKCPDYAKLSALERYRFMSQAKICSSCLIKRDHRWFECPSKRICGIQKCSKTHHRLLHNQEWENRSAARNQRSASSSVSNSTPSSSLNGGSKSFTPQQANHKSDAQHQSDKQDHHLSHIATSSVLFKIVPIKIFGEDRSFVDTFAFLDDGSSLTLLDKEISDALKLSGSNEKLRLQWTKGITREEEAQCVTINVSGRKGKQIHSLTNVYAVQNLDLPSQSIDARDLQKRFPHLRGLPITDMSRAKPKILIGLQHTKLLLCGKSFSGNEHEPVACKTRLGWIVFGNAAPSMNILSLSHSRAQGMRVSFHDGGKSDIELHKLVKNYFTTENFGVMPPKKNLISDENQRAIDIMNRTLKFVDSRYEIGLLWKNDDIKLPNSYPMALSRLQGLERSLKKKPELLQWKNEHVEGLLAKGYARKATPDELKSTWKRIWYCPTFIVINENKSPPKPRDVADVAAQVRGESLNSNLLKGPDNMAPLLSGLCKFRENFVAVTADVKEMFHQISIIAEDQQCQRFLWRNGDDSREPTTYIMQRMMFGPTCSPVCSQFVKNYHANQFVNEFPEAVDGICHRTYVDDYMNSHEKVESALKVSNDAIQICSSMGFDLRSFQSSHEELLRQLPHENIKSDLISFDRKDSDDLITKVLGLHWRAKSDFFTFKMTKNDLVDKMMLTDYQPTKREVLKTLMKTFDPLGLIAHYIIRGKIILQEIWREGIDWDEQIPVALQKSWKEFINELPNIEKLQIPRHYAPVTPSKSYVELIIFVDASEQAFAATAFFRFTSGEELFVAHVMAKAKVAPIKQLTIPQLELQAAVLGIRLAANIKSLHSFTIHETKYLSDSRTVLAWICSRKYNFKTFVAARVGEILEFSTRREWFYVGTKENVADDATKWTDPTMGNNQTRWFNGPNFLKKSFEEWPVKSAATINEDETIVRETSLMIHREILTPAELTPISILEGIKTRFKTNWSSLVRVIALLLRVRDRIKKKNIPQESFVVPSEFRRAEEFLFKIVQRDSFPNELKIIASTAPSSQFRCRNSRLFNLNPFIEVASPHSPNAGLLRLQSRAQKADVSYDVKNPIILPNKHELVDLFIAYVHEKNFHIGEEVTIANIRERVWVIDIRSAVQRAKRNCQLCKILRAKPQMPKMGELPIPRIDFGVKPFTHTGLDAFGPFSVKFGRGTVKRYGLILTCLTYRAVHLEVLEDLSTDHCIMAIRRFLVRRGGSCHFYSDNGKNFVGARNVLNKDLAQRQIELSELTSKTFNIHWHFQPAYSPWWGGAWERLIQSIKKCMEFVMKGETPQDHVFRNALIEAEFWMNRRPLTHIPLSHEDDEPLTPNLALFGRKQDPVAAILGEVPVNEPSSRLASRRAQHLVDKYLNRWVSEYLPNIMRRSKWINETKPIAIDDIVIVTDPSQPKTAWKKARVIKLHSGQDNITRAVDVEMVAQDKLITKSNIAVGRVAILEIESSASVA